MLFLTLTMLKGGTIDVYFVTLTVTTRTVIFSVNVFRYCFRESFLRHYNLNSAIHAHSTFDDLPIIDLHINQRSQACCYYIFIPFKKQNKKTVYFPP